MVLNAFNPSPGEEAADLCEFKASLVQKQELHNETLSKLINKPKTSPDMGSTLSTWLEELHKALQLVCHLAWNEDGKAKKDLARKSEFSSREE